METKQKTKFKQTEIGMIPEDWDLGKFRVILSRNIRHGIYKAKEYADPHGVRLLKMGDVNSKVRISDQKMERVFASENEIKRFKAFTGNLIFARTSMMTGGLGNCSIIMEHSDPIIFDGNLLCVDIDTKVADPEFYLYYFKSKRGQNEIAKMTTGTQSRNIPGSKLMEVNIPLLSKQEQSQIASVLSCLDSKMELNQQMYKTLEVIGQTIFKHWFVDFEFPNEDGKPYKSSGGEMVYNEEFGKKIPNKWRIGRLREFIDLDRGLSYKGAFLSDEGIPMINLGTIAPTAGFIPEGLKYYVGEYKEKQLVKAGDVVIANTDITQRREVLGSPAIVPPYLESEKALFTHHIFAVRNKSQLPNSFIFHLLQLKEYKDRVKGFATGTTVLALPKDAVLDFDFIVPDAESLKKFNAIYSLLFSKSNLCHIQNRNLSNIRDSLLPKLMSGKIGVPVSVN